jgi:O-antigen ligase
VTATVPIDARAGIPSVRSALGAFYLALIGYYWLYTGLRDINDAIEPGSAAFLLYVAPVALFAAAGSLALIATRTVAARDLTLAIFLTIVCSVAAARGDFDTISSLAILCLPLLVVSVFRLSFSMNVPNLLFLASFPLALLSFAIGASPYGIIPGMGIVEDEAVIWRISLFPGVAESGFFAAVVLVANLLQKGGFARAPVAALAAYVLLFSGIRSALIATLMALVFAWLSRGMRAARATMLFVAMIGAFLLMFAAEQVLTLLPTLGNETLNNYLFRSAGGVESVEDVRKSVYRTWIWLQHFNLFVDNPWLGAGTFSFETIATDEPVEGRIGTGSESFLTGLLARVGIIALLFIAFLLMAVVRGIRQQRPLVPAVGIVLFVAMFAYGSFIVSYNFLFLLTLGLLFGSDERRGYAALSRSLRLHV